MAGFDSPCFVLDESFPLRLRLARAFRDLTQFKLADRLGLGSLTNIRNWEARGVEPGVSTLAQVARALNVSADYLVGVTDNPEPTDARPFTAAGAIVSGLTAALLPPDQAAQRTGIAAERLKRLLCGAELPTRDEVIALQGVMEGDGVSALTAIHRHALATTKAAEDGVNALTEELSPEKTQPPARKRGRRAKPPPSVPPSST